MTVTSAFGRNFESRSWDADPGLADLLTLFPAKKRVIGREDPLFHYCIFKTSDDWIRTRLPWSVKQTTTQLFLSAGVGQGHTNVIT